MHHSNLSACKAFYESRDADNKYEQQWGYTNPIAGAYWHLRDDIILASAHQCVAEGRHDWRILEIGVGHAHELAKFAQLGTPQTNLIGVDLVFHRLGKARTVYPSIQLSQQDAQRLAFKDNTFNLVCQFTCLMHAPCRESQRAICREMVRVLKPGGLIIWWDIAPPTWRVILARRWCHFLLAGRTLRELLSMVKHFLQEALIPAYRRQVLQRAMPAYILTTSAADIAQLFPGLRVRATNTGVDYSIWELLWPRSQLLAKALWHWGWLSQHCFAVIQKT